MRKILFILMAVCTSAYTMVQAQGEPQPSIVLERLAGQDMTFALAQVGKLTFTGDSIFLVAHEGNVLGKEALAKTRKIAFGNVENPTVAPEVSVGEILVYPNPTSDNLIVSGLETGSTIRIYANDGKLLEVTTAEDNTAVMPVSHLAQGMYLLQINTTIVKFIKK